MEAGKALPHRLLNLVCFSLMGLILIAGIWLRVRTEPLYGVMLAENVHMPTGRQYLYVRTKYSYADLKRYLKKQDILSDTASFDKLARTLGYPWRMKPGRFKVWDGMNNLALLNVLATGRQEKVNLDLQGVRFRDQFAYTCSQYLEADESEIASLMNDKNFLAHYHAKPADVLSHILCKSYKLKWNTSAKELMQMLLEDDADFWTDDRLDKAKELGLSRNQVVALASIVQEETMKKDEAPVVAGVYLNRLHKGMRLQADPTLKYLILQRHPGREVKRLYQYNFYIKSPYNTYLNTGLPPGPVVLPKEWAIDAVLNAEKHDYLYFVARADFSGYHSFSRTYKEHEELSKQYRDELDRRNIH